MPVTFKQHTFPNGLNVIAEVDPAAHTAACGYFVKTGARDEAPPVMGVSHFLEHMMFKGTHDITSEDLNRRFDDLGARNNAFTSSEMTCFYASTLPEKLLDCVNLLGKMMRPALRQSDFDTEKGVILEEIAMYKDNPFWVLYEATVEKYFGSHSLAHRVLGTDETITALTRDQMQFYFDTRYSADNTTIALAGRMDFDRVIEEIDRVCSNWPKTGARREYLGSAAPGGPLLLKDEKVNRAYVLGLSEAPSMQDDRRFAASLLAQILGASENSRLHWALVETGLAEQAQASFDAHDGIGQYYVFASGDPDRLDEIWSVIEAQVAGLIESISTDDLDRLRNKIATATTVSGERPSDRMHRLGRIWATIGQYRPLEMDLDRIVGVTLDDLRAVHAAYPVRPRTVGRLLPTKTK